MMNVLEFAPKIEEWLSRVAQLLQNTHRVAATTDGVSQFPEQQQQLLMVASQELQSAMEELHVAQTELLQQNQELVEIREAVEAERLRYQELFEFAPDGYLVTDVNGTIQEANRAAVMMLNIESRFLVGKPLSIFIAQPERCRFYALLTQLSHVDRIQEWEVGLEPRKGTPLEAALSVTPVHDKEGKRMALRWLLHDITDRKRAEEQRRLLAYEQAAREAAEAHGKRSTFLAEASRVLASSLDYQTTLRRVAQLAVPTLADWCFIDIIENNLADRGEPVVAASEPVKEALLLKLRRRYPLPFNADNDTARVLQTGEPELVSEIPDSFLLSVAQDEEHLSWLRQFKAKSYMVVPLTARRRKLGTMTFVSSQPERHYSRVDLMIAVELAQRCAIAIDNARLYQDAQEANRIKDEFLAIVSHELRTPLNAILGWVNILRNRKVNESLTTRALETIERNAKSQTKLIEDILDISRIIRGNIRLNTAPVHLASLIHAVIENVRPTAEIKAIQIKSSFDPSVSLVMGDKERLQQIVWNLLSNAVKFTPEKGCVEVRLEQVNSTAQFVVKDTGKGINIGFLPYVFDRFRQADSTTTRPHGGLGLGLAIVRQLVEMHNGMVYAASEGEGKGATFTVQLPVIEAVQEAATEENASVANIPTLEGLRVLVVDDSVDTLDLIAFILEQYKAQVRTATSVDEALHAIAQIKPDILISDIGMPDQDGYALIRQVRTLEADEERHIPAVALTAFAREEERSLILNSGFQMHIPKPVEPTELVAVVANMAGRNHSQPEFDVSAIASKSVD